MEFDEIKKVRLQGRLKVITIPKKSKIQAGDFIAIKKIEKQEEKKE